MSPTFLCVDLDESLFRPKKKDVRVIRDKTRRQNSRELTEVNDEPNVPTSAPTDSLDYQYDTELIDDQIQQ